MGSKERWRLKQALKNARRREDLKAAVRNRPEVSAQDRAWAAGCFEGEGTATIVNANGHTRGIITLTNTDEQIVQFFQTRWPGTFYGRESKNPRHKKKYVWTVTAIEQSLKFIADILPLVISERMRQRLEVLNYTQRIRIPGSRDKALRAELDDGRLTMSLLNAKGPSAPLLGSGR